MKATSFLQANVTISTLYHSNVRYKVDLATLACENKNACKTEVQFLKQSFLFKNKEDMFHGIYHFYLEDISVSYMFISYRHIFILL